ncbi:MAG: hypothetical protein RIQ56_569 [Candidatus Parcubacteria bacterium]
MIGFSCTHASTSEFAAEERDIAFYERCGKKYPAKWPLLLEEKGLPDARQNTSLAQTGLHRLHGGTGASLSAELWGYQFPVFLRHRALSDPRRHLAREPVDSLDPGRRHHSAAGTLERRSRDAILRFPNLWGDRVHVRLDEVAVPSITVALPRLDSVFPVLRGLPRRIRQACVPAVGHGRYVSDPGELLLPAAT